MTPKIQPLDDRILIELEKAADKSPGGILLPEIAKQKSQRAKVLAVGPGKLLESGNRVPMSVSVGDVVLFGRYAGNEIPDMERWLIVRHDDILAVVKS